MTDDHKIRIYGDLVGKKISIWERLKFRILGKRVQITPNKVGHIYDNRIYISKWD